MEENRNSSNPNNDNNVDAIKAKANEHFRNKEYDVSISLFTKCLSLLSNNAIVDASTESSNATASTSISNSMQDHNIAEDKVDAASHLDKKQKDDNDLKSTKKKGNKRSHPDNNDEVSIIYANRSAAYANLGKWNESLADANSSIKMNLNYSKAYARKLNALIGLMRFEEAMDFCKQCLKIYPGNDFFIKKLQEIECEINIKKIIRVAKNAQKHYPNGRLCSISTANEKDFIKLMFKCSSLPEKSTLPRSFDKMLNDKEFSFEISKAYTRASIRADTMLDNIAKRAKEESGEVMTESIREQLMPQVFAEALGLEIMDAVRIVNERLSAETLKSQLANIASPLAKPARMNQISNETIDNLFNPKGDYFSQQNSFLGNKDWIDVLWEDIALAKEMGQFIMEERKEIENFWPTGEECKNYYPAIEELIRRVSSIPYEMNFKLKKEAFCELWPGSCAIKTSNNFNESNSYQDRSEGVNTVHLTIIYCIGSKDKNSDSIDVNLASSQEDGKGQISKKIKLQPDNILLYWSDKYSCYASSANKGSQLALLFTQIPSVMSI